MEEQIQGNPQVVERVPMVVEKKKSNTLLIVILLIVVLLIPAGVYAGMQIGKKQTRVVIPTAPPQNIRPTEAAPTSVPDETANWKIYNSSLLNYSIKYPQIWSLFDLKEGKQIEIYFQPDKTKSVGEVLIEEIDKSIYNRELESGQIREMLIGSINSKCKTDNVTKTWCYLFSNNKYLSILIVKEKDLEYNKIIDQILSTFKFLKTTDETANWKTYENKTYGISFKYPSDYKVSLLNGVVNLAKNSTRALLYIPKFNNPELVDVSQWFFSQPKEDTQPITDAHTMTETVVNGRKALRFIKNQPETGYRDFLIVVGSNSNIYYLYFGPQENEINIADQILSTIKFSNTTDETASWKTYKNDKYGFSFNYQQEWKIKILSESEISLSNIAGDQLINIVVWDVTGFGYCYKYDKTKQIVVDGRTAETADGIGNGGTEMCQKPKETMLDKGNTFVLIPLATNDGNKIHISYDYPLSEITQAKSNLNQILSTFKFLE